jgi:hypothetical protein
VCCPFFFSRVLQLRHPGTWVKLILFVTVPHGLPDARLVNVSDEVGSVLYFLLNSVWACNPCVTPHTIPLLALFQVLFSPTPCEGHSHCRIFFPAGISDIFSGGVYQSASAGLTLTKPTDFTHWNVLLSTTLPPSRYWITSSPKG